MSLWKGTVSLTIDVKDYIDSKFTHRAELISLDKELASRGLKIRKIESRINGRYSNAAIRFTPKCIGLKSMSVNVDVVVDSYSDSKYDHNIRLVGLEKKLAIMGWIVEKTSCRNKKWVGDLAIRGTVDGICT